MPFQTPIAPRSWPFAETALAHQAERDRLRQLQPLVPLDARRIRRGDHVLVNFSANDYLGLAKHPQVIAQAVDYTQRYGTGATASRLVAGNFEIHQALEAQLAQAVGHEAALLFGTGFQANATVLPALVGEDAAQTLILCDRRVHRSLLQGVLASGARFVRFPHNDMGALEQRLVRAQGRYRRLIVVSETVFSMEGDRADIETLVALGDRFGALVYLDDAHALGVLGPAGMGLAARRAGVDVVVGTFGKACGASGAFVACSSQLRAYLVNFCAGVIYTTALPPGVVGAVTAALQLLPTLEAERAQLAHHAETLRQGLAALGYGTGGSRSQIVPAIVGAEHEALALAAGLVAAGFWAIAIRPPTVAVGQARLRFALSSQHRSADIEGLLTALAALQPPHRDSPGALE